MRAETLTLRALNQTHVICTHASHRFYNQVVIWVRRRCCGLNGSKQEGRALDAWSFGHSCMEFAVEEEEGNIKYSKKAENSGLICL